MLFEISSAPEVFQRRPQGIRGFADDFIVVGFIVTLEQATLDRDKNLATSFSAVKKDT